MVPFRGWSQCRNVLHTYRTSALRLQAPRRGCGWASVLLHLLMKRIGNADGLVAAWRDVQYWTDGMGQPLQEGHGKALVVKYPLFLLAPYCRGRSSSHSRKCSARFRALRIPARVSFRVL